MRRSLAGEQVAILQDTVPAAWGEVLRGVASLVKYRLLLLVLLTMLCAAEIAAHGAAPGRILALVLLGGGLAAAGAAALNHYIDRDIDAVMLRTRSRPVPSGVLSPRAALTIGIALLLAAVAPSILASPETALWVGLAAFTYVVIYTCWLKRRSPSAVVVGSLTGSFAVLAGWSAIQPRLSPLALVLAAIVCAWTPAHFWAFAIANSDDYRRANIPTLPNVAGFRGAAVSAVLYALATVALAAAAAHIAGVTGWYVLLAVLAGAIWLGFVWRLLRQPAPSAGMGAFYVSNAYLALVFTTLLLAARR